MCAVQTIGCNNSVPEQVRTIKSREIIYEREPSDSGRYIHVKEQFYIDSNGELYEKKRVMGDSSCFCDFEVIYDKVFRIWTDDSSYTVPLKSIVDVNSFVWLDPTEYSKDKNRVYYFHGNSDGGTRHIVEGADPRSFKGLCEYRWGIDKKHVYYKGSSIPGLDIRFLAVLYPPDTSIPFVDYIKDHKNVYYGDERVTGANAKTFILVRDQMWDAEDKFRKYKGTNVYR